MSRAAMILLAMGLAGNQAWAEPPALADGWSTWQVDAVTDDLELCCYQWSVGQPSRKVCQLDEVKIATSSMVSVAAQTGQVQIYMQVENGTPKRLLTLSPDCAVATEHEITDLGLMETGDSLELVAPLIHREGDLGHQALLTVAVHEGACAADVLVSAATGSEPETRKQALFWMAQYRVDDLGDTLRQAMREDPDESVRQHATFSYAQSPANDRIPVLIELVEDSGVSLSDRKQALFWLAQADNSEATAYLEDMLIH